MIDLIVSVFDLVATVVFMVCVLVALRRLGRRMERLERIFGPASAEVRRQIEDLVRRIRP